MNNANDNFKKWIRNNINTQAAQGGNSVALGDYSKDGMTEYSYPKRFTLYGDKYYWDISSRPTKGRHLTTHYELWFHGRAFGGDMKIALGQLTLAKLKKGLKIIYDYYCGTGLRVPCWIAELPNDTEGYDCNWDKLITLEDSIVTYAGIYIPERELYKLKHIKKVK